VPHDFRLKETAEMTASRLIQDALKADFAGNFWNKIRPEKFDGPLLGKSGSLEVRLAQSAKDIKQAQKLRYQIFYENMSAVADLKSKLKRRDMDPFDDICDHLLVIDTAAKAKNTMRGDIIKPRVIGTYRLLRQDIAERHGGFYSAQEFELAPLFARHASLRFLELGRSCVEPAYRDKRTIELLWHGIWAYVREHKIDALFGCASFAGSDPDKHAPSLSFLHHHAQAGPEWQVPALPKRAVSLDRFAHQPVDPKSVLHEMPPLIKAYMRVGARFGKDGVIDHQFNTFDVLVMLPVADIHPKYVGYFGADGRRFAA
jgi:putative hemolysin